MAINYAALKTEITTDPNTYGYVAPYNSGQDQDVAILLNQLRAGIVVNVQIVTATELQSAVVGAEFSALSDTAQRAWQCILACGAIPMENTNLRAQIAAIWGEGTATRASLLALQTKLGSRAEQLFGVGTTITHADVAKARLS